MADPKVSVMITDEVYRYLVVDSGPIIRLSGLNTLWKGAKEFYTVPAVLQEIRDAKAREHLESLPFELIAREASPEGIHAVIEFARKTGDYQSLSAVDIQVLGLLYDLEHEGCGTMDHVRKTPKRTLGIGKMKSLGERKIDADKKDVESKQNEEEDDSSDKEEDDIDEIDEDSFDSSDAPEVVQSKTWAGLVNSAASKPVASAAQSHQMGTMADRVSHLPFGQMKLASSKEDESGQFSDAEDDPSDIADFAINSGRGDASPALPQADAETPWEEDVKTDFPSLSSASHVNYEVDEPDVDTSVQQKEAKRLDVDSERLEEERKRLAVQPISKSGKLYNSFSKYGDLFKPTPSVKREASVANTGPTVGELRQAPEDEPVHRDMNESRIMGATGLEGQGVDVEDDGEGWITCSSEIRSLKATCQLDPTRNTSHLNNKGAARKPAGPPAHTRAACATTDFAMQNVILQMNLELLSVDGVKVRKLKSWVTRCGACFKIYTSAEAGGPMDTKRMFCERCGSDMMQRISASVDGKTGRLRLHLSKRHKHNLRGTKFSLPKPGSGNRFQGDLLLREDQLLMGAWNQKVKMNSGGKARSSAESMFGKDIASNVGCHAKGVDSDDIRVGFGRRNPNAVKGRERRGKKKKSVNKACGLHRY